MSQRRDDTTETPARDEAPRAPGSYYYDDTTGYEPYDPAQDEDREDDDEAGDNRDAASDDSAATARG